MTSSPVQLWEHQRANVDQLLDLLYHRMSAADCSETGTGKTVTALETVRRFNLPFVVVCPKSVKSHWKNWIETFQPIGKSNPIQLSEPRSRRNPKAVSDSISGNESFPKCLGVFGWEETKLGKHPSVYSKFRWFGWHDGTKHLVIFDEAHRAKNGAGSGSLNAKMVQNASEQGVYLLLLSATLIQSALDLSGLALPLKLITDRRHWFAFARQFGCRIHPRFGGYDDGSTKAQQLALGQLLDRIRVRTRRDELSDVLGCITQADLVDSAQLLEIREAYDSLARKVRELEAKEANAAEIITARLRGRQAVELLKTAVFVEQALEHLENGFKVALFFNFTESVDAALQQLKEAGVLAGRITGDTSGLERDEVISAFNSPDNLVRAMVLNIAAGGEGIDLSDRNGAFPRIALLSPPESATTLVQACGRVGGRLSSKSVGLNRLIYVAGTVEEDVHKNVKRKIRRLELLNDGDLTIQMKD